MLHRCRVRWLCSVFTACLLISYASQTLSSRQTIQIAHNERNLLRLHVLANSDSPKDQNLKLAVRDALIPYLGELASRGRNAHDVETGIRRSEHMLIRTAEETLRDLGAEYPVRVEIDDFSFPETSDSHRILSPGDYRTVRVIIGEGGGRNWWCVLFPPLSLTEEGAGVSVAAVSSQHVNRDGIPIEVRWRFLSRLNQEHLARLAGILRKPLAVLARLQAAEAKDRP
ncbi:MAG: stage II sporulation protein R [Limnochordia bacterium]|jgi:stage II sporulation protein R